MIEITSQGPVNRHITEYLTTNPRVKQYKCKTLQNPDYFYDGQRFGAVDVSYRKDTSTDKAGGIWLRDKAIVSVGTKKADDAYKLFGLRPDENQSGSESLEFSVESIEINGKPQTINLRDRVEVSPITTKFGDNLYVQHARQRTRVMVEADNAVDGFKIALRLYLKGLTVTYRKDIDEYWIYNDKGQFRFRLGKPYLVDPADMNPLRPDDFDSYPQLVKHSLTEINKGEYLYVKEPTEAFGKVKLPEKFLIDVDTVYSSTADGYVEYYGEGDSWETTHAAATGVSADSTGTGSTYGIGICLIGAFDLVRSFFYYNLAGIAGTVLTASEIIYGKSNLGTMGNVSTQQGAQSDTLVVADFDAFSGDYFGNVLSWNQIGTNAFTYNAAGIAAVQNALGSVFKTCMRNYTYDYLNSEPAGTTTNGLYYADYGFPLVEPNLIITFPAVGPTNLKTWNGVAKAAIAKINGVAIAGIKTWNGVA